MRYVFSLPPTYIFIVTSSLDGVPINGKDLSLVMRQLVETHRTPSRYLRTSELKKSYRHYYIIIIIIIVVVIIIIIIIINAIIELTHSKTILENSLEIMSQTSAFDFENLS